MNINNVNRASSTFPYKKSDKVDEKKDKKQSAEVEAQKAETKAENKDTFTKSATATDDTGVYFRSRANGTLVTSLMDEQSHRMEQFQQLIRSMIAGQGEKSNLSLFGLNLNVTPQDSMNAAASIAEGGEYSVDAVATRILNMAEAMAGGDASKISTLRAAVEKGFKAAGVELGGKLPGICQDTYTEVMKRFDDLESKLKGIAVTAE